MGRGGEGGGLQNGREGGKLKVLKCLIARRAYTNKYASANNFHKLKIHMYTIYIS